MSTVEQIESAIKKLPEKDVRLVHEWLDKYAAQLWDKQIERDAQSGGPLRKFVEEAKADYRAGRTRRMP
jgi:hypothetical protein